MKDKAIAFLRDKILPFLGDYGASVKAGFVYHVFSGFLALLAYAAYCVAK